MSPPVHQVENKLPPYTLKSHQISSDGFFYASGYLYFCNL